MSSERSDDLVAGGARLFIDGATEEEVEEWMTGWVKARAIPEDELARAAERCRLRQEQGDVPGLARCHISATNHGYAVASVRP